MKLIYGSRGTGKTRQLLEYAAENRATVITKNARALRVKAQSYGINVDIVEADSLTEMQDNEYEPQVAVEVRPQEKVITITEWVAVE